MNKRQKKKLYKKAQARYCMESPPYPCWCCPNCGWDHLEADPDYQLCQTSGNSYDHEGNPSWDVYCKCPVCGTEFEYSDGV